MIDSNHGSQQPLLPDTTTTTPTHNIESPYARRRRQTRELLTSHAKHYFVMGLVATDVAAAMLDILLTLAACDAHQKGAHAWTAGLHWLSLSLGGVFAVELGVSLWAFGIGGFFRDWFHCFDAVVIVGSLVVDMFGEGVVEDVGGLVVGLRLWRFGKMVEELSVAAAERREEMEERVRGLEKENEELRRRVEVLKGRRMYGGS